MGDLLRRARLVIGICVGLVLLTSATLALIARYLPIPDHAILYLVIAAPYLMLGAPIAILVLAWGRRWVLAGLAVALTAVLVVVHLPAYIGSTPEPDSVAVRVMTMNMRYGNADPDAMTRLAQQNADVVMAQELNPKAVQALFAAGLTNEFRYQALEARPGAAGVGLYSRYPITNFTRIGGYQLALVSARIRIDGITQDVTAVSVHFAAPWPQAIDGWKSDIAAFPTTLADLAAKAGDAAVIVGGDFNSTVDMRPFRRLLTNGYGDAAMQAGDGRNLTYPANRRFPPLIGIDHVLTRNATVVSTSTVEIPDTDHRALLTTIMVPGGMTGPRRSGVFPDSLVGPLA